jgi:hypothetical protein
MMFKLFIHATSFTAPHEHTVGIRQLYKVDLPTEALSVGNRCEEPLLICDGIARTRAEYPVCTKPIGFMRPQGKTVHGFLRPVAMTPYILQEYSSGTGSGGSSAKSFSNAFIIANAERREYLDSI